MIRLKGGIGLKTLDEKINEHIEQCNEALEIDDFVKINRLANYLYSLYRTSIKGISGMSYQNKDEFGEIELRRIKDSLELYLAKEMHDLEKEKCRGANVSLSSSSDSSIKDSFKATDSFNPTNTVTNTVTLDLKAMFDSARKIIEEDEALGEEEVEEIISRINEIEGIGNENIPRPQKWRKLKDCVNWISTKGVKVAMQVMPLITEILKMQNG